MINILAFEAPLGKIHIAADDEAITMLHIGQDLPIENAETVQTPLLLEAKRQLEEYFCGRRKVFDLPLSPSGTAFQKRVWRALTDIPYGETRTYKDIAIAVDTPRGFRAVGLANHKNPIAIIVPCHRVIGSDGSMTGYAGGIHLKEYLLNLEQAH